MNVVQAGLWYFHLPGQFRLFLGHQTVIADLSAFTGKGSQIHIDRFRDNGKICILCHIRIVGVAPPDTRDISIQVGALVLVLEIVGTPAKQDQSANYKGSHEDSDESVPPFP